jgi:hypothetical protein
MKLRHTNQIELSVSNLRALVKDIERREREGMTVETMVYKITDTAVIAISVVADEDHYSDEELAQRTSPYLPPDAWAGAR